VHGRAALPTTHRRTPCPWPSYANQGPLRDDPEIRPRRTKILDAASAANPSRFAVRSTPPALPTVAWINEPQQAFIQNVERNPSHRP